MLETEHN